MTLRNLDLFRWKSLYPKDSNKCMADVLMEFEDNGRLSSYSKDGDIDFCGFKILMDIFLEVETPEELSRHLFLSFVRIQPKNGGTHKRLHGLTEKLHALGSRSADSEGPRSRTSSLGAKEHHGIFSSSNDHGPTFKSVHSSPTKTCSRASSKKSNHSQLIANGKLDESAKSMLLAKMTDINSLKIPLKDVICYLSLLEAGRPEDKLEFMFRLYDTDGNGFLDNFEMDSIVDQMMTVAEYIGWETKELRPSNGEQSGEDGHLPHAGLRTGHAHQKFVIELFIVAPIPLLLANDLLYFLSFLTLSTRLREHDKMSITSLTILQEMMIEIDYDSDGTVSLDEWKRGGMTTIPLLVLLGLDTNIREDGNHLWRLKHFSTAAYCNLCLTMLAGMGRKGLSCILCKYTVHERCVQRAPASCISTYVKSTRTAQKMLHHWVEGNTPGKCSKCKKQIKSYNGITGLHCRWCHLTLHNRCSSHVNPECKLGVNRVHILPPISICPTVLDRQRSMSREKQSNKSGSQSKLSRSESTAEALTGAGSFQITPMDGTQPLLVFVNPKSGGRQGAKILRKCQYLLNPRQVYNLSKGGPNSGLQMFREVPGVRIIVCGGDGTVGWVLDALDRCSFEHEPSVGVIPLGTGNDLARCLRWGGGYEGESMWKLLNKIEASETTLLDRWSIQVIEEENGNIEDESSMEELGKMPFNIINNYFSIGVDAAICCKFHLEREKNPQKFNNRMKNKLWYFEYATSEQFSSSCKNLHDNIELICDGVALNLADGPTLQGIAILNIPSTHGGTNMWGDSKARRLKRKKKKRACSATRGDIEPSLSSFTDMDLSSAVQDIGDKLIEVVGLENSLHMGQVRTGLRSSGKRLAQCSHIIIKTKKHFPMQIDGEPWEQPPCTLEISHRNQVTMLMGPPPKSRSFFSFLSRDLRKQDLTFEDYLER
eukprot:snap_masked-scaffold180_size281610-processed-gene-1.13 protein:Tk11872 transcript:snap_masked-scaffold180_size281610-processed-gene-1.13-mRNA-1 annotation:"diacylglycerol kinase beta"